MSRLIATCILLAFIASGCSQRTPSGSGSTANSRGVSFRLVAGSENKAIEPLVKQYARTQGVDVDVSYLGSVDISRELEKGLSTEFDAVWPAASIWIALGDNQNVAKLSKSICRSPVVFGVKRSFAERLGWPGKDVTVAEILAATKQEHLRLAMTSATQSNSGASFYLGCLSAFSGQPEVLTSDLLADDQVRMQIRDFLGTVNRSAGSSGWLKEMVVERYNRFDAMINYEFMVIEANQQFEAAGKEPYYVVYPVVGLTIADSPLAYIDRGDSAKEAFFKGLQDYLLSADSQQQLARMGRRTGILGGALTSNSDSFKPEWGIDPNRVLSPIRMPTGDTIREALNLYQVVFRKPSLTAYVVDYSGSMEGAGESQLKEAMFTLLDQDESSRYLLQASSQDVTLVLPFNERLIATWRVDGNDPAKLRELLAQIEQQPAGGGTQMYSAVADALRDVAELESTGKYHTAIILMSDGVSDGSLSDFQQVMSQEKLSRDVPIFTILFGRADPSQMEPLATSTGGRMFDGRKDVIKAFREAKGYN
ncbi:MAG: VWA domain-containing protein [Planctomycetales bacterium]|nr:VWA domain-containing protein [Planctomycetales bacterium]MCA9166653.1 VWA domain-containing protein [Planctomycetales bacterium]